MTVYVNPRITLYLFFDSQITKVRTELESRFYFLSHQRLSKITDDDLSDILFLLHKLQILESVYVDLQKFF